MEIPVLQQIFLILLAIAFVVQLIYLLVFHNKLNSYKPAAESDDSVMPPVSVIISARNEAENLQQNLSRILEQQYPQFEVVVVNDCSIDSSEEVLEQFEQRYSNLKIVRVTEHPRYKTGKKFAVTMGIKAAKYPNLVFTDADSVPDTTNWLNRMALGFQNQEKEIILGYSPYYKKGGLLNAIIRFETIKTAINYFSAALRGNAYMGVGRNLAYRKELFFESKGFASHMHVLSGDDDLFVNQNATKNNTTVEIHPDSFMYSEPKSSFTSWFRQKRRHMGAGKFYKAKHKRMLGLDAFTGLLFYAMFFTCLFFKPALYVALALFLIRWLLQMLVYRKQFMLLKGRDLLSAFPFFDMAYYLYLNIFGLIGTLTKTSRWK